MGEGFNFGAGDQIGIVGIGAGAYLGLHVARALMTTLGRGAIPVGFWAVHAPIVLPSEATDNGAGWLVDCPVHYLVGEAAKTSSPWRWEVQTMGPFSWGVFKSAEELPG